MVVVGLTEVEIMEVLVRSNLIYIWLCGSIFGACSCGSVIVVYSVTSLTRDVTTNATTTTLSPPPPPETTIEPSPQ